MRPLDPGNRQFTTRPVLSLDGDWEFALPGQRWRTIRVPGPWQANEADLRTYTGTAMYRRRIRIPSDWAGRRIRLCFGAVDYRTSVEVNGALVGQHEGGYLPFCFDIQGVAAAGTDAVVDVTVSDDMSSDVPKGKQSWYGPLAGIWQSVWLEATGDCYISRMRIDADAPSGTVSVRPQLDGDPGDHSFHLIVRGPEGETVSADDVMLTIPEPKRWDLEAPNLYEAQLRVIRDGTPDDSHSETFGFRTVEARDNRIWLNGRPILLVGALDQDYYPETMCTPPSYGFLRNQVQLAKELGLNCLRCHIKVPDPRYLDCADRAGMFVWAELPSWENFSPNAARRGKETLVGMIERDANHPCILAWTIVNESWGVDLVANSSHRAWLGEMVDVVRKLDPSRIIVDNSPCRPNFHVRGDLNDFHFYTSVPDQRERWDEFLDGWTNEPGSSYSPNGDATRQGGEPMVVSEFGNWGLPDPSTLREQSGNEPWWFDTGQDWAGGVVHPHGIEERARRWGLDVCFGGMAGLFRAAQEHQFESLQYEVEQMRLRPEIAGFVVTELTDVYWECNGLLDMFRRPKARHANYKWIFGPDLPIAVPNRRRCFAGDQIHLSMHVARASDHDLVGSLQWRAHDGTAGGKQQIEVPAWGAPAVCDLILQPTYARRMDLELELADRNGETIGRNWIGLSVYDRPPQEAAAWSEDREVLDFLEMAGWPIDRKGGVRIDKGLQASAPRTVLLAQSGDEAPGVQAVKRIGSPWEGDWAQGMHWIGAALRAGTPLLPRLDLTCSGVVPEAVLTGPSPEQTLSGMYVGWIHKAVATAAVLRKGVVATTFPILEGGPQDPLALWFLHNLIREASR